MRETAQRLVSKVGQAFQAQRPESQKRAELRERVLLAGEQALAHGVTSFHDAGVDFATIDFYKEMEAAEELPIRLNVMIRGRSNAELEENLAAYRMVAQDNDFLTVRSIKRQVDGRLGRMGHGCWRHMLTCRARRDWSLSPSRKSWRPRAWLLSMDIS